MSINLQKLNSSLEDIKKRSNQPTFQQTLDKSLPTLATVRQVSKQLPPIPQKPKVKDIARELLIPSRGFSKEETAKGMVDNTLKERLVGTAKGIGEIGLGLSALSSMGMRQIPGLRKLAGDPEVIERYSEKLQPKTAGEAGAMRMVDVLGFVAAPTRASKLDKIKKALTQVDNVNDARKLLRSADLTDDIIKRLGLDKKAVAIKNTNQANAFVREVTGLTASRGISTPTATAGRASDITPPPRQPFPVRASATPTPPPATARMTPQGTQVPVARVDDVAPDLDAIRDMIIRRLEEQKPSSLPGGRPAPRDIFDTPEYRQSVENFIEEGATRKPTLTDVNKGLELLRVSGRQVDDLAADLRSIGRDATQVPVQSNIVRPIPPPPTTQPVNQRLADFRAGRPSSQAGFVKNPLASGTPEPRPQGRQTVSSADDTIQPSPQAKQFVDKALSPEEIEKLPKTQRVLLETYPELATDVGLKGLKSRSRGPISHNESLAAADSLGWTEDTLLNLKVGRAFNDRELAAIRGIAENSRQRLQRMKDELVKLEPNSPASTSLRQEIALQKTKAFKLSTIEVGAASEAGRSLSLLRSQAQSIDAWEKKLARIYNDEKTPQYVKDFITDRIARFEGTPEQYNKLLRDLQPSTILGMSVEFATAMKLYALPTHVVNTITSAAMLVTDTAIRPLSALINAAESTVTGAARTRFLSDAASHIHGANMAWSDTGRNVVKAFADENYAWEARKIKDFNPGSVQIKGRVGKNELLDRALDKFGKGVRTSFRLLGVEDVLIRTPAERANLYTAASRMAIADGHKYGTKAHAERMADILKNPTAEMVEQASKFADEVLFQEDLHRTFKSLQSWINNEAPAIKFVIPFFRTIVNLQKRFLEFSPAAPLLPSTRKALGGADSGARADAVAKMITGSTAMFFFYDQAIQNNITLGTPKNPAERDAFFAEGKQAYSIKIGDKWYPYHRLSPFSEWFVTAGLMAEAIKNEDEKTMDKLMMNTVFNLSGNLFEKSFATGLNDLMSALTGQEYERERWLQNFIVGSTYPTLMGNITRSKDPVVRQASSIKETYMSRTPFLSEKLPARRDVFGEPITRPGSGLARLISPVIPSEVTQDIVRSELKEVGVVMGFPDKSALGFKMSDEEYRDFQIIAGRLTYKAMFNVVTSPQWDQMSARQKEETANRIIREVRTNTRALIAKEKFVLKELQNEFQRQGVSSDEAKKMAEKAYLQLQEKQSGQ
jgi:hypothetical protein